MLFWFLSLLLALQRHVVLSALDTIIAQDGRFILKDSNLDFRIAAIQYQTTNATDGATDSLSDPDACLRDAALFQRLGINAIQVSRLSVTANHDECMSIFNSIGVYVLLGFDSPSGSWGSGDDATTNWDIDLFERAFKLIDSFQNYNNVLLFNVRDSVRVSHEDWAKQQPYLRSFVQSIRRYVENHSSRTDIPIGHGITMPPDEPETLSNPGFLNSALNFSTCSKGSIPGRIDFAEAVPYDIFTNRTDSGSDFLQVYQDVPIQQSLRRIPFYLSAYRQYTSEGQTTPTANFSSAINGVYLNDDANRLSGLSVASWSNALGQSPGDTGLVDIQSNGDLRMRPAYNNFQQAYGAINSQSLRAGTIVSSTTSTTLCFPGPQTIVVDSSTYSYNSSLATATPPSGVEDMITNGASGSTGQFVSVTNTVVSQTIRAADGAVMSGLAITINPDYTSSSMPTSAPAPANDTGRKIGLGVGLGVGIPILLALIGLGIWALLRRRKRNTNSDDATLGEGPAHVSTTMLPSGMQSPATTLPPYGMRSPDLRTPTPQLKDPNTGYMYSGGDGRGTPGGDGRATPIGADEVPHFRPAAEWHDVHQSHMVELEGGRAPVEIGTFDRSRETYPGT